MNALLPEPPAGLECEEVRLFYVGVMPGDDKCGLAPCYHHRMLVAGADVGHINFRVGESDHVRFYAGHIGYEVKPVYRGQGYAGKACRALVPPVLRHYAEIILTTDPDNLPSVRTIEKLGATFDAEARVPPDDPLYRLGARSKRRYCWVPSLSYRPVQFPVTPSVGSSKDCQHQIQTHRCAS